MLLDNWGGGGGTKPASKLSNYVEQSEPQENTRASGEAVREGRKTHSRLLSGAALAWIIATPLNGEPTTTGKGALPIIAYTGRLCPKKCTFFRIQVNQRIRRGFKKWNIYPKRRAQEPIMGFWFIKRYKKMPRQLPSRCSDLSLLIRYVKKGSFSSGRYTNGVPFLVNITYKRVRGWILGRASPYKTFFAHDIPHPNVSTCTIFFTSIKNQEKDFLFKLMFYIIKVKKSRRWESATRQNPKKQFWIRTQNPRIRYIEQKQSIVSARKPTRRNPSFTFWQGLISISASLFFFFLSFNIGERNGEIKSILIFT